MPSEVTVTFTTSAPLSNWLELWRTPDCEKDRHSESRVCVSTRVAVVDGWRTYIAICISENMLPDTTNRTTQAYPVTFVIEVELSKRPCRYLTPLVGEDGQRLFGHSKSVDSLLHEHSEQFRQVPQGYSVPLIFLHSVQPQKVPFSQSV